MTHNGLSDFSFFLRKPLSDFLIGPSPGAEVIALQNALILEILDQHLKHKKNAFPENILARYPELIARYPNQHIQSWWETLDKEEQLVWKSKIEILKVRAKNSF